MNNALLNIRSELFVDDHFENVEKRCFLLICGKQATDPALSIDFGVNAFDDPRIKKNVQAGITLDQVIIEYNNEILKNLSSLGLQYKIAFKFSDLHPATRPSKLNKNKTLWRVIELQAPLYALKKQLLRRSMQGDLDTAIKVYHANFLRKIEEDKPHA
jgi:hypothetical protein